MGWLYLFGAVVLFVVIVVMITFRRRARRNFIAKLGECLVGRCEHEGLELISLTKVYPELGIFTSADGQSMVVKRGDGNWKIPITVDLAPLGSSSPYFNLELTGAACGARKSFPCVHGSHVAIRDWIKERARHQVL